MRWQPDSVTEAIIYVKHMLANVKDPKIAVLMQNDDYGKDYLAGPKQGLGKDANNIVQIATYEVTDPTVESQVIELKNSGANVFFDISTPKFAAQLPASDQEGDDLCVPSGPAVEQPGCSVPGVTVTRRRATVSGAGNRHGGLRHGSVVGHTARRIQLHVGDSVAQCAEVPSPRPERLRAAGHIGPQLLGVLGRTYRQDLSRY